MAIPNLNPFSTFGRLARNLPRGIGTVSVVCATSSSNNTIFGLQYPVSDDTAISVQPVQSTFTAALALTTAAHGDQVLVSQDYTTVPTAAEIVTAQTNNVDVRYLGVPVHETMVCYKPTLTMPVTGAARLLATVTGLVRVKSITGIITTAIQNQACNLKLSAAPTDQTNLATVDICSNLAVANLKLDSLLYLDGTLADAMINVTNGAVAYAPSDIIIQPGTITWTASATNTGAISWRIEYVPLQPGAYIY